jgi:CheY-like chemotaxis protein
MSRHPLYIILISAKNEPLDRHYGLRQGADRYLPKPFTARELVQTVWEGVPLPTPRTILSTLAPTPDGDAPVKLSELLPRRASNQGTMRTSSPFTSVPVIEDEQAHRLYTAIDGRKTLAELSSVTGLENKALARAARVLLKEHCIQIYDTAGRLVERPL